MQKSTTTTTHTTSSSLEKFSVHYEYDMSWHAAKKAVRNRRHKNQ